MKRHDLIWLIGTLLGGGALMAAFAFGFGSSAIGFGGFALVSMILLAVRDIFAASHKRKTRQEAMRQVATRLGCAFRETAPVNVLGWSESFHLTRDGVVTHEAVEKILSPKVASVLLPKATNVMERSLADATVTIFDYACDRSKREEVTTRQTVLAVRSPTLEFPHLALIPSNWWSRLVDGFRGNVALPDGYRVITEDAGALERLDERLHTLLDGRTCLEAGEGFMLLYRRDALVAPQDIDELARTGVEIYSVLTDPTSQIEPPAFAVGPSATKTTTANEDDVTRIRLPKATPYAMTFFGLAAFVAIGVPLILTACLWRWPAEVLPYVVGTAVALLVIGGYFFVTERRQYGPSEFCLTIRKRTRTMTLPGLKGESDITIPFDRVKRVWLEINNAKFTDPAHMTFDPCVAYVDESGAGRTVIIAKYLFRERARDLVRVLKKTVGSRGSADVGDRQPYANKSEMVPVET
jgi:hypothetical protein